MNFLQFQDRLLSHLRERVRNGELTERGLALSVGISQPHIHRVLKGDKALSLVNLDLILQYLRQNLLHFCTAAEMEASSAYLIAARKPMVDVPLYLSRIGPGCPWQATLNRQDRRSIPCDTIGSFQHVALARLSPDPAMNHSLQNYNLALLTQDDYLSPKSDGLYAIARGQEAVIRRIRHGGRRVYLVTDRARNRPLLWEAVPLNNRALVAAIIGRVIWMGSDEFRHPARSASIYLPDEATSSYAAKT